MNRKGLPIGLLMAAIVVSVAEIVALYGRLPPQVATHFDAQGRPDGWSTKEQFVGIALGSFAFVLISVMPIALIAYYAPISLINLPNKQYWLAPERESETRRVLAEWGYWFAAATLWLLTFVFHEAMVANLRQPPQMQPMGWLLGTYFVVVAGLVIQLIFRFRRVT